MKKIGILGGTFDPPHLGHLITAEHIKTELNLGEVWFIPTYEPPHKKSAIAQGEDRLKMLELATQDNSSFKVVDWELKQAKKSYTINTIKHFKRKNALNDFYFIMGADMVESLSKWKDINELKQLLTFVGVNRKGYTPQTSIPVILKDMVTIDISSSFIRNQLSLNKSIKYLVPNEVYSYIKEFNLYETK